jgi:hypothetical protein
MKAKTMRTHLVPLLVVVGCSSIACAQTWTAVTTTGPTGREGSVLVYDAARQHCVLFGGSILGGSQIGDTWRWNGSAWSQASVAGPGARELSAAAYDSARARIVLFGGYDGTPRADTWEWNGGAWLPQVFASGPVARYGHALAFDSARGRVVMFGGLAAGGGNLNDTWEWDGLAWSLRPGPGPSGRAYHAMAYDANRGRTVLFGGSPAVPGLPSTFLADTWEWDGTSWLQPSASGPSARSGHAMIFDSSRSRTVLVGGYNGTWAGGTWEWDGSSWVQVAVQLSIKNHGMAYDASRSRIVAFGGETLLAYSPILWEMFWSATAGTQYGAGCGSPALSLVPLAPPSIGTTARAAITNVPSAAAVMSVGFNNTAFGPFTLPLTLVGFGMTGCDLWTSADLFGLGVAFTSPTTATFDQPLPNNPAFVGLHLYLQAFAIAPGANPGQIIASNGLDWIVGY